MLRYRYRHGTTGDQALRMIRTAITEHGYSTYVEWKGRDASVSVGLGAILRIKGTVTDMEVILECGGAYGEKALMKCEEMISRILPNGSIA